MYKAIKSVVYSIQIHAHSFLFNFNEFIACLLPLFITRYIHIIKAEHSSAGTSIID